jgi:hypothetical protein
MRRFAPDSLRRVGNALERWRYVLAAKQRGKEEVELALVLPTLGQRGDAWVRTLLRAMAASDAPGAAWIASLARGLLRGRSENTSVARPTTSIAATTLSPSGAFTESQWSDAAKSVVSFVSHNAA